jgi:hypothetical protein
MSGLTLQVSDGAAPERWLGTLHRAQSMKQASFLNGLTNNGLDNLLK